MSLSLAFKVAAIDGSLAARTIAWWTRPGGYCHAELWLAGPRENALCFSSTLETGTRIANINLDAPSGLYRTIVVPCTESEQHAVMAWCSKHIGERYDKLGIVGFVIPFGEHAKHEMFCSEACGRALEFGTAVGRRWKLAGDHPWRISPNKLAWLAQTARVCETKGVS